MPPMYSEKTWFVFAAPERLQYPHKGSVSCSKSHITVKEPKGHHIKHIFNKIRDRRGKNPHSKQ